MRQKLLLLLLLIAAAIPPTTHADDEIVFEYDDIYYFVTSDNTVSVTYKSGGKYSGDVIIPKTVSYNGQDYTVTGIGYGAFYSSSIQSVKLPDTITEIGKQAFRYCRSLTELLLPNDITSIGESAFSACDNLINVTLPRALISIPDYAFSSCSSLKNITIPENVVSIGREAFSDCHALERIMISKSVSSIDKHVFYNCSSLNKIEVSEDNPYFASVDGVLYNKDLTSIIKYPSAKAVGDLILRDNVQTICSGAFDSCLELTGVTFPNSLLTIESEAFYSCPRLTSVTIPESVTQIQILPFYACENFADINVAPGNERYASVDGILYDKSFSTLIMCPLNNHIDAAKIPASIKSIGDYAFWFCDLTSFEIPNSVTTIGAYAFCYCSSLADLTIGNSVTNIGQSAFANCGELTSLTIPNTVTKIDHHAFQGCEKLKSITLPNSLTAIEDYVISICRSLSQIDIPESVTSIGVGAFWQTGLTDIKIPTSVISVRNSAFGYCENLTSIVFPHSVKFIGEKAFAGCEALEFVTVLNPEAEIGNLDLLYWRMPEFKHLYCYSSITGENIAELPTVFFEDIVKANVSSGWLTLTTDLSQTVGHTVTDIRLLDGDGNTIAPDAQGAYDVSKVTKATVAYRFDGDEVSYAVTGIGGDSLIDDISSDNSGISIRHNPMNKTTWIAVRSTNAAASYTIHTMSGAKAIDGTVTADGEWQPIPTDVLTPGIYLLTVTDGTRRHTERLTVR